MTQLGEQVRAGRTALGLTLAELASRAEIDPGDLSRIENGKIDPRFSTAARLFDALGLRVVPRGTLGNL